MKKWNVPIGMTLKVTEQDIEDIVVTALEGGIGYWACLDNRGDEFGSAPKDEPVAITASKLLLAGKSLKFIDVEDEAEVYDLTIKKLLNGIKLWWEGGFDKYRAVQTDGTIDCGEIDSELADVIVQMALFEEVVFG